MMYLRFLLVWLVVGFTLPVTAQFTDDFSDGDFTNAPTWTGESTLFLINGNSQLQTNGPAQSDTAYLRTGINLLFSDTITWEFWIDLGFNPSDNNRVQVYLTADQTDLTQALNGYYLRIGESGTSDAIKLYRQSGNTTSLLLTGMANTYGTSPTLRVRVQRDPTGLWTIWSDPTGGTSFVQEGSISDATFTTSTSFGVWCKYTSSNSQNFSFDDFVVSGTTFVDTTAPALQASTPLSATELDVQFSEALDPATAQNTANYSVNLGVGAPNSAQLDGNDPSLVHLVFGTPFTNGATLQLTANAVEDLAGNAMTATNSTFFWFQSPPANFQDVVFNELFPDPSPPVALPEEEFIELFNASNTTFDLAGWEYSDASSTVTLGAHLLLPGEYVILCSNADTALFAPFGTVIGLSSWPALNNSGDNLSLRDNSGNLVDRANYDLSWYGDVSKEGGGFSLERINPFNDCGGSANWLGASSFDGGTPGVINSVFDTLPDTIAPMIAEVLVISTFQIEVVFTEGMDSLSLANATYSLDQGGMVSNATANSPGFQSVTLNMAAALDPNLLYELTITGASDCGGNTLTGNVTTFGIGAAPLPLEVVFNELYPDPDPSVNSLPDGEFIEIINTTNKLLRLDGYEIADLTGFGTLGNALLLPNDRLILCPTSDTALWSPFGTVVPVSNFPSLNSTLDFLLLREPSGGAAIDALTYSVAWYGDSEKATGGWTLERINPINSCGGFRNWRASNDFSGGTPGAVNSIFNPNFGLDPVGLEGIVIESTNQIVVSFDQNMFPSTLASGTWSLTPSLPIDSIIPDPLIPSRVVLELGGNLVSGTTYELTVDNVFDCIGGPIGPNNSLQFALATPLDVVINEVLFDPFGSGTDFVELYNRSAVDQNLNGWGMAVFNSAGEKVIAPIADTSLVLAPGSFLLLNEDDLNVQAEYPQTVVSTLQEVDLPSYPNSEGTVILVDNLGITIDSFAYTNDLHFALLQSAEGFSLERLDYERPTGDPSNWHSAAESAGMATPGFENSQFDAGETSATLALEPEVFSPDNDGQDDVLNIRYQMAAAGFVANISIYDARGRLVRRLVENELLAREGTLSWDGITDEREKALTGIHVVWIEVFDLDGNREVFKKPCVVATRL